MSVSDAAPLPRLGEVFFDVRGNSRSMRLSWYADTGVAVFSIWQAGMCTGTFRLPIGDLSRMIEILERGPSPQGRGRAPVSAAGRRADPGRGDYPGDEDEIGLLDSPGGPAGQGGYAAADYAAEYGRSGDGQDARGGVADYPAAGYGSAGYGDEAGYEHAGYGDSSHSGAEYGYGTAGHRGDDFGAGGYQPADYGAGQPESREPAGYEYHEAGYGADYASGGYSGADDYLTGEHTATGYRDEVQADGGPDYFSGSYGSQPAFPAGGHRRDDGRFPPDTGGLSSAETDGAGYQDERFVPPYVGGGGESYRNDNRAGAAGYERDLDDAGYPADPRPVSPADDYHEARWPGDTYSYDAEYRRR